MPIATHTHSRVGFDGVPEGVVYVNCALLKVYDIPSSDTSTVTLQGNVFAEEGGDTHVITLAFINVAETRIVSNLDHKKWLNPRN